MTIVERGRGSPVVLVPSLLGRWEFLSPTVDALARSHRVIAFSFADEQRDLDHLAAQIEAILDDRGLRQATICGVSFGGRVALRFAALHPERTSALVLVSVPGPRWHLRPSHRWCAHFPRVCAPLFFAGMLMRLWAELAVAIPGWRERRAFIRLQLGTVRRAPLSPSRMAARALLIDGMDAASECAGISAPTLVVSGEMTLDHVVPSDGTCEYTHQIAGSCTATLEHTGHLGCITRPAAFAALVDAFLHDVDATMPNANPAA